MKQTGLALPLTFFTQCVHKHTKVHKSYNIPKQKGYISNSKTQTSDDEGTLIHRDPFIYVEGFSEYSLAVASGLRPSVSVLFSFAAQVEEFIFVHTYSRERKTITPLALLLRKFSI